MIAQALEITGVVWLAGSVIVLGILVTDYIAGVREDRWMWGICVTLGPVALVWSLYLAITDRDR